MADKFFLTLTALNMIWQAHRMDVMRNTNDLLGLIGHSAIFISLSILFSTFMKRGNKNDGK